MDICQKPESTKRPFRMAQPGSDLPITRRERRRERGIVTRGNPPSGPVLRKNEKHGDSSWDETEATLGNDRRQPRLRVKDADRLLQRAPLTLGLRNDDGPRIVVRPKNVDRAALAPLREGDLGLRAPALAAQRGDRRLHDRGVSLVEQAIEGGAVPPWGNAHGRAQASEVIADVANAEPRNVTRFQLQGEMSRSARRNKVALTKPLSFS